jgi:transcriptional regulator with XRE-family HTH domain
MNPYKKIRLENSLTQKEVAKDLGITSQVILRVEQGLFSNPPPQLTSYLAALSLDAGMTPNRLSALYFAWVYQQRKINSKALPVARAVKITTGGPMSKRYSWKEFRKNILGLSVAGTAKLLVIQISLLQDMEKTGRNQAMVKDILLEWGIPTDAIHYDPPHIIKRNNLENWA